MYLHPFNHKGKHRRLRAFDVECFNSTDSNWTKVKDQSALDSVSIGYHGSGYVDGILVMVEGQGAGFVASFQVSINGSIISTSVQNAGSGYTSDGLIDIRYPQLASQNKLKPSNYSMSGSISVKDRLYLFKSSEVNSYPQ